MRGNGFKDERGNQYSRLYVVCDAGIKCRQVSWLCLCNCGNYKTVIGNNLRSGGTRSCGCLQKEQITKEMRCNILVCAPQIDLGERKGVKARHLPL